MHNYRMSVDEMLGHLNEENIKTWFDLGIFIDKLRETKPLPTTEFTGTYNEFRKMLAEGGLAFITFLYSVDGVTIEVEKYAQIFRKNLEHINIHYIGGRFYPEAHKIIDSSVNCHEIPEIDGFDDWALYKDFFFTKLERGGKEYNELILKFWQEVLTISEKLGKYIQDNNIKILYLINVCSNPGNVSLALATILVSEYLGIPVVNNNHDFYWEGSTKNLPHTEKPSKPGPRDFFFTNSHLGEIFSLIEVLYPWESRSWVNVNINRSQSEHLIKVNGHNPANVTLIGTAVDINIYHDISKRRRINAFFQFEKILSRYQDTLKGYSVADVLKENLIDMSNPLPILIGAETTEIKQFLTENIIFLQPTRIISRKRIELGFKLIKRLFNNPGFAERLRNTPNLKLTILVTGPIAVGHNEYYRSLLKKFNKLLKSFDKDFRDKIYLAFLFSELDKESYKKHFDEPVGIPELYNIASLVLLPSKTEGRGLPIIESTACGTPIFCSRYYPENVYSEVIGENLPEKSRLKVIEFDGKKITAKHAERIIERVLFPHLFTEEILHNKNAVKRRYSLEALTLNMDHICKMLFHQLQDNSDLLMKTETLLEWYSHMVHFTNDDLESLLKRDKRHYLPGYGRLSFMGNLASLIDPSSFRKEEQEIRGFVHAFAQKLVNQYSQKKNVPLNDLLNFYTSVDNIFHIRQGETFIRHDHSFSYRHRNKNYYPFQDYTVQELTGLVNILFIEFINPRLDAKIDEVSQFFTDLDLALAQLTASSYLAIDDRKILIHKLQQNLPFALFPGEYTTNELEFFVLQAIRSRLKIPIDQTLTEEIVVKNKEWLESVYVIANQRSIAHWFSKAEIEDYIVSGGEQELKLLYEHGILNIVNSKQICVGLHFPQMGEKALKTLRQIRDNDGFIIANRPFAAMMSDIIDIDRFHIGKAKEIITANVLGIPQNSGYIQFVPAGLRVTLAYPTPIQTAKDFHIALNSGLFKDLANKFGEKELFTILKKDAEDGGSPILNVLQKLNNPSDTKQDVKYQFVNGLYSDGMPWNGVYAKANTGSSDLNWNFRALTSDGQTKRVTQFVSEFETENNVKIPIAWNGGYILNPELVGKLGLPESYIGSPLGLLISDACVTCPPLFNKAALLIHKDGKIEIRKVNCSQGIKISLAENEIELTTDDYNLEDPGTSIAYYDLLYRKKEIGSTGRYIVRLAGNEIKEIIPPGKKKKEKIIPVGLTLSFPKNKFPKTMEPGQKLTLHISGIDNIVHAIEAGPYLLHQNNVVLDMKDEGWKTQNSIRTQAARLDYTDMRGPKIAAGIDRKGNLLVLVINGRIRESVGATHMDMAEILKDMGIEEAMGFDPGGSSTLVVNGKVMNISPYNHDYEKNNYALPPEPRAVSNAIVGYPETKDSNLS